MADFLANVRDMELGFGPGCFHRLHRRFIHILILVFADDVVLLGLADGAFVAPATFRAFGARPTQEICL